VFSAWPAASASSGTEPNTTPASATNTNATLTFAQETATWGTGVLSTNRLQLAASAFVGAKTRALPVGKARLLVHGSANASGRRFW